MRSDIFTLQIGSCDKCGACFDVCPHKCFTVADHLNKAEWDGKNCTECKVCIPVCHCRAISVFIDFGH